MNLSGLKRAKRLTEYQEWLTRKHCFNQRFLGGLDVWARDEGFDLNGRSKG